MDHYVALSINLDARSASLASLLLEAQGIDSIVDYGLDRGTSKKTISREAIQTSKMPANTDSPLRVTNNSNKQLPPPRLSMTRLLVPAHLVHKSLSLLQAEGLADESAWDDHDLAV